IVLGMMPLRIVSFTSMRNASIPMESMLLGSNRMPMFLFVGRSTQHNIRSDRVGDDAVEDRVLHVDAERVDPDGEHVARLEQDADVLVGRALDQQEHPI